MLLVAPFGAGYDGTFGAYVVALNGAQGYLPWPLAKRVNGGTQNGFGHLGRRGFLALFATPEAAYLQVRTRVHRLHEPPSSVLRTTSASNELRVIAGGRLLLRARYKPVAARWPYRSGAPLDADEEEDHDFYLWLHRNLTTGWETMRVAFAEGF